MLTQLNRLTIDTDGCYAKPEELKFVNDYLQSLDVRLSAYAKVKENAEEIIAKTEAKMKAIDPNLFRNSEREFTDTWRKDIEMLVRYAAAALLFNDQDHLREGLLLWHHTIATSYKFDTTCKTTFDIMPEVIKDYLTEEEAKLFVPILKLNQIVLV